MLESPRRALNRTRTEWVDIKVDYMTMETALFWDQEIQPDIRQRAQSVYAGVPPPPRADECGLERYPAGAALLSGRSRSDGRHFFAIPYLANELVSKLSATR